MNFNTIINVFCTLAFAMGVPTAIGLSALSHLNVVLRGIREISFEIIK